VRGIYVNPMLAET